MLDLKAAYSNVAVHSDDRWLLGLSQLFVDRVLPFGLRSAPKIFMAVADAMEFMLREREVFWVRHYLDDFVLLGPARSQTCGRNMEVSLGVCRELRFPV